MINAFYSDLIKRHFLARSSGENLEGSLSLDLLKMGMVSKIEFSRIYIHKETTISDCCLVNRGGRRICRHRDHVFSVVLQLLS